MQSVSIFHWSISAACLRKVPINSIISTVHFYPLKLAQSGYCANMLCNMHGYHQASPTSLVSLGGITGGILQIVPYLVSVTISPDTFGAPYVTGIPWYHSWYPVDSALAPPPPPLTPVDNLLCALCTINISFSLFGQVIRLPPYFFTLDMCRFQEIMTRYDGNGDIYV